MEIPVYTKEAIDDYVEHGTPRGDFLTAVICNRLKESFQRADDHNLEAMQAIVGYMYNEVPLAAWGSEEKMDAWMAHGGLAGLKTG